MVKWVLPDEARLRRIQTIHRSTDVRTFVQKLTGHTTHTFVIDLSCPFCNLGHASLKSTPTEKNVGKVLLMTHSMPEYICVGMPRWVSGQCYSITWSSDEYTRCSEGVKVWITDIWWMLCVRPSMRGAAWYISTWFTLRKYKTPASETQMLTKYTPHLGSFTPIMWVKSKNCLFQLWNLTNESGS